MDASVRPLSGATGVAVLGYEKRGVGGSTGDWKSRELKQPTLALFGELDNNIVAEKNKAAWKRR